MNDCCTSSASRDKATVSTSATVPSLAVRPGVTFPDWSVVSSPVVKEALLAMVGSFIGWQPVLLAIMIGALLGSLVGGGLIMARLMRREQYIPFGPFLAIGSLLALLFHESLFEWYWSLIDLPR